MLFRLYYIYTCLKSIYEYKMIYIIYIIITILNHIKTMSTSTSENSTKDEDIPQKKHPDTSKDYGGLIINDKDASNTKVVLEIMKNLAKKLVTLNVLDMLKFSRPAKITSPITVHQCSAK